MGPRAIADAVAEGDKTAVSRALNLIEDRRTDTRDQVAALLDRLTQAERSDSGHRIGLTGPPGVGKSTLAAALARDLRRRGRTVGVLAVDPTSLRSGGSLLGDRARMGFDPSDRGVFVRSMPTAGEPGGLAYAANAAVRVLAAAYEIVLVETTGVGQSETDIVYVADTVALVVQPGSGDVLQFLKAGIMEIPDVLVVNKADQSELASRTVSDLEGALGSAGAVGIQTGNDGTSGWRVPVVSTSARDNRGLDTLVETLDAHRKHLGPDGLRARRRDGEVAWTLQMLQRRYGQHGLETLGGRREVQQAVVAALDGGSSPVSASDALGTRYLEALRSQA